MAKYDHLLVSLPKGDATSDDPVHQSRINAVKEMIRTAEPGFEPFSMSKCYGQLLEADAILKRVNVSLVGCLAGQPVNAVALVRAWRDAREVKDALNELESNTSLLVEAFEQMMLAAMEAEDAKSIKLLDGRGANMHYEPNVKVVDKEALRQWCDADPDLRLKMQVWPSTMASHVKDMMMAGEEPPPGTEVKSIPVARKSG